MGIYIKGLDIPKEATSVTIEWWDEHDMQARFDDIKVGKIVEIPTPHGRLIDGDKLTDELMDYMANVMLEDESISKSARASLIRWIIDRTIDAPNILEAEE